MKLYMTLSVVVVCMRLIIGIGTALSLQYTLTRRFLSCWCSRSRILSCWCSCCRLLSWWFSRFTYFSGWCDRSRFFGWSACYDNDRFFCCWVFSSSRVVSCWLKRIWKRNKISIGQVLPKKMLLNIIQLCSVCLALSAVTKIDDISCSVLHGWRELL